MAAVVDECRARDVAYAVLKHRACALLLARQRFALGPPAAADFLLNLQAWGTEDR